LRFDKKNITKEILNEAGLEFANGSQEAFNFLYKVFSKKVYRFCVRMLDNHDAAKDAFQETFIRIYEFRKMFSGKNFESWLFTIARNTCINYIRRHKTNTKSLDEVEIGFNPRRHLGIGIKEQIEEKLNQLPIALKEAFVLRDMEDLTYEQIAEVLEIDISLAKVRVHRARLKLKELLKPLLKEINEAT